MDKDQKDFEFLLHEFDSAQEDIKQISERRYNLIKFYSWLIVAIISAIGFFFGEKWQIITENKLILSAFFAFWAIIVGIVFLVFLSKEQLSVNRCLNKINAIRKSMNLVIIKGWENPEKRDINMDTEYLKERKLGDNKFWARFSITRIMVIVIFLASLCFMGLIILSFSSGFFRLFVLWRELILFGLLLVLFIILSIAFGFSIKQ